MSENQNIRGAVDAIAFGYQNNQLCVINSKKFGSQEF
jgi:hypothetical protein